jgi:hypothetical protein
MDRKIILYVLGAAALGFIGIMMLMPQERGDGVTRLPWLVSTDTQGRTQVFGFTIGETTLADVRAVFAEQGKINLFSHPDKRDRYSVEAYFDQIYLNGLRSDFVITLDADRTELEAMYERGLRISQLGSGGKKVKLAPDDIEMVVGFPIRVITYLPWKSLDAQILERRFGKPEQVLSEQETDVTHWLYPAKGMDIALDQDGGVVIQYVNPGTFEELITPLQNDSDRDEPTRPATEPVDVRHKPDGNGTTPVTINPI